jgi:hypothetical protein
MLNSQLLITDSFRPFDVLLFCRSCLCAFVPFAAFASAADAPAEFAPRVWIDWARRTVEAEATVVLREGPLELFACSPRSREHESILTVAARPLHLHQALGLIGLEPGTPVQYDEKRNQWRPPQGDRLELRVRYRADGLEFTVPPEDWMVPVGSSRSLDSLPWVFAGARTLRDGRFGADTEGTVVAVVDFDTALIAVGELHTADNEQLWLAARKTAIPPVGTACRLLIRSPKDRNVKKLNLTADGTLREGQTPVSINELVAFLRQRAEGEPPRLLVIEPVQDPANERLRSTIQSLHQAGIDARDIELHPPANSQNTEGHRPRRE